MNKSNRTKKKTKVRKNKNPLSMGEGLFFGKLFADEDKDFLKMERGFV